MDDPVHAPVAHPPRSSSVLPVTPVFRMAPARNVVVVGFYLVLLGALFLLEHIVGWGVTFFLMAVLLLYLGRELSIHYVLDDSALRAQRIFGWRSVPLDSIRKIDRVSLRDISPVSAFGSWGWRSRMWSPTVGKFDNISSAHAGLMVYGDGVPLFISPRDPEEFGRELSSRTQAEWAPSAATPRTGIESLV